MMSSRHHCEPTNAHKQYHGFISDVKNNTILHQFVYNGPLHRRYYICVNALWAKSWRRAKSLHLNSGGKSKAVTARTSICGEDFVVRRNSASRAWIHHGRYRPSARSDGKDSWPSSVNDSQKDQYIWTLSAACASKFGISLDAGVSWTSIMRRVRSSTPVLLLGSTIPYRPYFK